MWEPTGDFFDMKIYVPTWVSFSILKLSYIIQPPFTCFMFRVETYQTLFCSGAELLWQVYVLLQANLLLIIILYYIIYLHTLHALYNITTLNLATFHIILVIQYSFVKKSVSYLNNRYEYIDNIVYYWIIF